ncbi:UbiA family prenyltransferase [Roseivirga sp. BDSF3-8]|uniref:UbiA family prenyltransferase n=1 Tax=Roseivirga sp. BDSF3-8 TaxID=3241598 RepID=UPI003531ACCC
MISRSTWLHLRLPFSFFLLPVFLLALSLVFRYDPYRIGLVFFILHFLLYPASNGYNSYFDKDEDSIGGLEKPPKVKKELYWVSILLDVAALLLGLLLGKLFVLMAFIYGLVSKAYSHPAVRLKKMPVTGWLAAGIFQGAFTVLMVYAGLTGEGVSALSTPEIYVPALLSSILLLGSYPMTQIYQHDEDGRRGDETISRKLGVPGTFHFTAVFFAFADAGFVWYFINYRDPMFAWLFQFAMLPVLMYFLGWYMAVRNDPGAVTYRRTMRLNLLSAFCLNVFFLVLTIY